MVERHWTTGEGVNPAVKGWAVIKHRYAEKMKSNLRPVKRDAWIAAVNITTDHHRGRARQEGEDGARDPLLRWNAIQNPTGWHQQFGLLLAVEVEAPKYLPNGSVGSVVKVHVFSHDLHTITCPIRGGNLLAITTIPMKDAKSYPSTFSGFLQKRKAAAAAPAATPPHRAKGGGKGGGKKSEPKKKAAMTKGKGGNKKSEPKDKKPAGKAKDKGDPKGKKSAGRKGGRTNGW